jgi:capsular exopolysaccharide synthesis family protein
MDLREAVAALRASWWLPALGLVAGGAAALLVSLVQTPLYTSSTQFFVSTSGSASTSDFVQGSQFSKDRVTSYTQLLTGEDLASRVVARLGLSTAPSALRGEIAATAAPDTVLIDVTVTDASPQQAQRIAEAIGTEFPAFVGELETPQAGGTSPVKVTVTEPPKAPTAPSSPKTYRNVTMGLLVGLLVGGGLAVARARLDRSVKDPDEVSDLVQAPVMGVILRDETLNKQHVIDRASSNRTAEEYRQLRTNLQFLNVDNPPTVIMVTSAVPSEGKTTLVVNLALTLADLGRRVTVVEADLRQPKIVRYLGLVAGVGLTNVLAGTANVEEVSQGFGEGDLFIIPAGPIPPNPGELLASANMSSLLDKLRSENDYVLVDAPPLLPVADSSGLAVHTDGVLLSVRYGSTRKDQLDQAGQTLARVGAKTLGVILNIVPPNADMAAAYGYGHDYGAGPGKHAS